MHAIHPNARTTPAVRAEIARSSEPTGVLARHFGVSTKIGRYPDCRQCLIALDPRHSDFDGLAYEQVLGSARLWTKYNQSISLCQGSSALTHSEGAAFRLTLARIALAGLVQAK